MSNTKTASPTPPSPGGARRATDAIKGAAILCVVANHYVNGFWSKDYMFYANGVIAVFFVLSGLGIFHSLSGALRREGTAGGLMVYALKRILRIYPVLWLALILTELTTPGHVPWQAYTAYVFTRGPNYFWFVAYIIQCYILAPFIFLLLRRLPLGLYLGLMALVGAAGTLYALVTTPAGPPIFAYRRVLLGHFVLFGLGMAIPVITERMKPLRRPALWTLLAGLAFAALVHLTRPSVSRYFSFPFLFGTWAFCLAAVARGRDLPLGRVLGLVGGCAYSIYLLHGIFIHELLVFRLIKRGSLTGLFILVALFPYFVAACHYLEKGVGRANKLILGLLPGRPRARVPL